MHRSVAFQVKPRRAPAQRRALCHYVIVLPRLREEQIVKQYSLFIGGAHVDTTSAVSTTRSTGEVVGWMPLATLPDLDRAVAAAAASFKV